MKKGIHHNLPCGDDVAGDPIPQSDAGRTGGDYGKGINVSEAALNRGFVRSSGDTMIVPPDRNDRYYGGF